jgi:hypothetical protein
MRNKLMPLCFKLNFIAGCLLAAGLPAVCPAASLSTSGGPVRMRSVVHADSHGRLVRRVVASRGEIRPAADSGVSISELVEATAKKYDVDPLLVHSVIQAESGYNPHAVSPKGAQGIMQLMPDTARRFGVSNSFDAKENIEGGVRYLKYLQTLFPDDLRLAIAAYNAGEGAVWKYNNQVPPYRETEQYVQLVNQRYGKARREAEKRKETASALEPEVLVGPVYASVETWTDQEGRLHLRTADALTAASEVKTP